MTKATSRLALLGALVMTQSWGIELALASEPLAPEPDPTSTEHSLASSPDLARADFYRAQADREFSAGNYRMAIEPLKRGYAATRDPRFLLNLGVTYHWLGECELARDSYEAFLKVGKERSRRAKATEALAALEPVCGRAASPEPVPTEGNAGSSRSSSALGGVAGPEPPSAANAVAAQPPAGAESSNLGAWSFLSAGAAALLGTAVSGALWWSSRSDYRGLVADASRSGETWDTCCAERGALLEARVGRYRAFTAGLGIGSAALITTGLVLWRAGETDEGKISVAAGDGVGLRYGATF